MNNGLWQFLQFVYFCICSIANGIGASDSRGVRGSIGERVQGVQVHRGDQ